MQLGIAGFIEKLAIGIYMLINPTFGAILHIIALAFEDQTP